MYPQRQHQYPLMDTGTMYHQPLLQHHIAYPTNQPPPPLPPPEPLPSATDVHTITLSISQLADFSATMVHLLWHERNSCIISHQSTQTSGNGEASSAFKKYCRSVKLIKISSHCLYILYINFFFLDSASNSTIRISGTTLFKVYCFVITKQSTTTGRGRIRI